MGGRGHSTIVWLYAMWLPFLSMNFAIQWLVWIVYSYDDQTHVPCRKVLSKENMKVPTMIYYNYVLHSLRFFSFSYHHYIPFHCYGSHWYTFEHSRPQHVQYYEQLHCTMCDLWGNRNVGMHKMPPELRHRFQKWLLSQNECVTTASQTMRDDCCLSHIRKKWTLRENCPGCLIIGMVNCPCGIH